MKTQRDPQARARPPLDPEIARLLHEIAIDPASSLLRRAARPGASSTLDEEPVSPWATGLTAAERELLLVYREEAALLLRTMFEERFLEDERMELLARWRLRLEPRRGGSTRGPRPAGNLEETISSLTSSFGEDSAGRTILESLGVGREHPQLPGHLARLAAALFRLVPDDHSRYYVGLEQAHSRQLHSAHVTFGEIAARTFDPRLSMMSLNWKGAVNGLADRPQAARDAYRAAAQFDGASANSTLSWCAWSLQIGDREEAQTAARCFEEAYGEASAETLDTWVEDRRHERKRGMWTATRQASRLARELNDDAPKAREGMNRVFSDDLLSDDLVASR
ncbi:MAG TPA: hypothetical protein QF764_05630 [Planctomycetota bacterium]|jgi:hypothetical protein|nr:hypothetical protein [Planctomycetota bacterium]